MSNELENKKRDSITSDESTTTKRSKTEEKVPSTATTKFEIAKDGSHIGTPAVPPPPHLYVGTTEIPARCEIESGGFSALTQANIDAYVKHGFILVRNGLNNDTIQNALSAIDKICEERDDEFTKASQEFSQAHNNDSTLPANGIDGPGIQFESLAADIEKGKRALFVRKLKNFHDCNKDLGAISYDSHLTSVVTQLIHGTEKTPTKNEIEIFQSLALLKPPKVGREKPWHQDNAYFNVEPEPCASGAPTSIVGIWIALDQATEDNGCMFVIPDQHQRPQCHFQRRDWQICDDQIPSKTVMVPMQPGDTLFFSSLLPHGTPPNLSDKRRRALQYHMLPKNHPRCPEADRLALFGGDGKGVQC